MSNRRVLRYQVMLSENLGLTIVLCGTLNPATLLPLPEDSFPFHSCLETLYHYTKPWEGLLENLLTNPEEIWCTDENTFALDGERREGYTVSSNHETIEAKPLPPGASAQWPELVTLIWALILVNWNKQWQLTPSMTFWYYMQSLLFRKEKGPPDHSRVPNQVWWPDL